MADTMQQGAVLTATGEPVTRGHRRRFDAVQPDKPKRKEYPFVCVGQTVLWYDHALLDTPPAPAIVTSVGDLAIDVTKVNEDGPTQLVSGVRYVHQKGVPDAVREESGGWDYTEIDLRHQAEFPELREWPDQEDKDGDKPKGAKKPKTAAA